MDIKLNNDIENLISKIKRKKKLIKYLDINDSEEKKGDSTTAGKLYY